MDTRTGEIVDMEEVNKMKPEEAKWFKPVPSEYVPMLKNMNRKQRREWYRRNKKLWKNRDV